MINIVALCVPYLSHQHHTKRAPDGAALQHRSRFNATSVGATAIAAMLLAAVIATTAILAPQPAQAQSTQGVCGRTPKIQEAIVDAIAAVSRCRDVTATQLAEITELYAVDHGDDLRALRATDFNGMTGLTELWLWGNSFTSLPPNVFSGLTSLQILSVGHNSLRSVDANLFNGLSTLTTLYLDNNELNELDSTTFNGLTALEELQLWENSFRSVPANLFSGLTSLEILSLGYNPLQSVDARLFNGLTALKTIYLNNNPNLTALDKTIFNGLTNLENIILWRSGLRSLDKDTFSGLSSIKTIDIRVNDIRALHKDTLSGLMTLEKFIAFGNSFGNIHEDTFDGLTNLEEVWLSGNGIASLDKDTFSGLTSLKELWLGSNELSSVHQDTFNGLTSLETLSLAANNIASLHEDTFDGLSSLQALNLGGNELNTMPDAVFNGLTTLATLSLSYNELTTIPANLFDGLSALRDLRMEGLPSRLVFPDGLLEGLTNLEVFHAGISDVMPRIFEVRLVRTPGSDSAAKLQVPLGAPFKMEFQVAASGGRSGTASLHGLARQSPISISAGSTESETFMLPTDSDPEIPNFVNNDGTLVTWVNWIDLSRELINDPPRHRVCEFGELRFSCYRGFGFANYISAPQVGRPLSTSWDSARIVYESEAQSNTYRYYYEVWEKTGATTITPRYSGFHDLESTGPQIIELRDLAPDQQYSIDVYGVDSVGILSMHHELPPDERYLRWVYGDAEGEIISTRLDQGKFSSLLRTEFRTAKQAGPSPPLINVAHSSDQGKVGQNLQLTWMPQETIRVLTYDGYQDLTVGYQFRFKKSAEAVSAYSQWQSVVDTSLPDGRREAVIELIQNGELLDVQIRAVTGTTDGPKGYSEPATTTVRTFIPVPAVNRIEPSTREISVRAGDRVRLSADVYDSQDYLANDDADNGEGAFQRWQPELTWSSASGGSFTDSSDGRSTIYTAPSLPGTYTVTAQVGPPGLCYADHFERDESEDDPCMTTFTVRVSRTAVAPPPLPDPVNPAFATPPTVSNDAGTVFSVFTPAEGGTFSGNGITVSANPGAVPDRAALAIAAESTATAPSPTPGSGFTVHGGTYDVIGMARTDGAGYNSVTAYRLNEPLTACLQVPWMLLDRLTSITAVEIRSDGLVGPLTSTLRTIDGATSVCATFSRVPATLALATTDARQDPTAAPTAVPQRELPETGSPSPTVNLLALVLLSGMAMVAVAVTAAVVMRARRPADTRARE